VAKAVGIETAAGVHEHQVWQLLSVLFDEGDKVPSDMTVDLLEEHRERYRKDKLSDFWKALVHSDAEQHAEEARTPEEKAIAHLSGHNVADACHALLTGLDLRLATMVAQIGGDHHMRRDMNDQLEEWRRMDVLSEMDESVRALYELLSGNCAASEGKSSGGRENKVSRFTISGRFGLDWRRAFGLRLWYGTLVDEPIELAVAQFADALRDNKDDALPQPWFVEQGVHMGWDDKRPDDREDLLWGILKLYASSKLELPANIEDILAPENVSGHPMNARLSFQLFHLFKARQDDSQEIDERRVGMPTVRDGVQGSFMSSTVSMAEKDGQTEDPLTELGDKLTLTYAASLHTPEHWTTALWVYMHLSSMVLREHYIRSLLNLYSHTYSVKESDATYNHLVNDLRLPHTWLHAAAALQAKIDGDAVKEVKHLIQANEVQEAHEVLRRIVGPDAIITREYEVLNDLLQSFFLKATHKEFAMDATLTSAISLQMKKLVPAWTQGGGLYFAYMSLLEKTSRKSSYRVDKELDHEIESLLKSLQHSLEIVAKERWGDASLEERVALTEIAGTVADLTAQNQVCSTLAMHCCDYIWMLTLSQNLERAKALRLPLTEDLWLRHTSELSVQYYRAVMTATR
jgi:nuclear pore complex protein Nup98-Nup96